MITKLLANHSLCNAHHIRELRAIYENYGQKWALDILNLLLKINKLKLEWGLRKEDIQYFKWRYNSILQAGLEEVPELSIAKKRHALCIILKFPLLI